MAAVPTIPIQQIEVNVWLKEPHARQIVFLRSAAKRKIIRAGRRGGKTTGVGILAVEQFLKGRRVLYGGPTADQLATFWREVKEALAEGIQQKVYYKNETEHIIELPGMRPSVEECLEMLQRGEQPPARIRAKTAWNADTLRGDYADVLILDEFQLMNEDAWQVVGAPMLLDNNGDAVFIYTPPSLQSAAVSKASDLRYASKLYKKAQADTSGRWLAVHFTSHDNPYISEDALRDITQDMTALAYKQEIEAEDVDEVPGALWTRALIEATRVVVAPALTRLVVGVDPTGSSTNEAGIVGAGLGEDNHLYVIADRSCLAPTPRTWASAAVSLYDELEADRVVGERNYGGDMVRSTIETVDDNVSYKDVNATRGKMVRAEPIAARFEKGTAHLVGKFPQLEDEMCSYVPGNPSPNRMDAMVWAAIELVFGGALGLVDFLKSGAAQTYLDATAQKNAGGDRATQSAHDAEHNRSAVASGERCPACGCATVTNVGGRKRCQECATQFGELDFKLVAHVNRTDHLNGARR